MLQANLPGASPSATPQPGATAPAVSGSLWAVLWDGIRQLVTMQWPWMHKASKPVLLALAVVVPLPLLVAFLAAYWLALLKDVQNPAVAGLRSWYLETINKGFSIEEVSSRSHGRLDYLHLIGYDMVPRKFSARVDMPISLQAWQKFELEFQWVEPSKLPSEAQCELPEEAIDLVQVLLNGAALGTLQKGARILQIDAPWWQANQAFFVRDSRVQTLSLRLTEQAAAALPSCAQVHVAGSLRVYKTMLQPSPGAR